MPAKYIRETNADYRRIRRRIPLGPLRTEAEYDRAVSALDEMLGEIRQDEAHPLADLAETVAFAIEAYEDRHVRIPDASGPPLIRSLMEEHGLTQSDIPEIGSQGVVSEVLSGKRDLNVRQIAQLAARFGVSPAVFIPHIDRPNRRPERRARKANVKQSKRGVSKPYSPTGR
jgi:HTH-type transcriptional regulator / antitoxin HigA